MSVGIFKNRVTEKDIRSWLDDNGFFGRSAEISDLELHAIKRPGWKQVFRFTANARPKAESQLVGDEESMNREPERILQYGIVVDDQRKRTEAEKTQIYAFESIDKRDELLEDLSSDMLTCSAGQNGDLSILLVVVVTFVILAVVLGSVAGN
jgi:hypothetical protein